MWRYLEKTKKINENNLPDLNEVVLWALELFIENWIPEIKIPKFNKWVIVWSWNALETWKVIFENSDVIFADENNYKEAMRRNWVDYVLILSASGWKHAIETAKEAKKLWLKTELITCNHNSEAEKIIWKENTIVTSRNLEPYTYNTSTYMWWILAYTKENPKEIYDYLLKLKEKIENQDFSKYNWFIFVLANEFASICKMIDTKFVELFWRRISRDIRTFEQLKHAITVVESENELMIRFAKEDVFYNWDMVDIEIPKHLWKAWIMAIWYFLVWVIQKQKPAYFKDFIKWYIDNISKTDFWKWMKVIV